MKKRYKRIIAAALLCIMLVSLLPTIHVSAANDDNIKLLTDYYKDDSSSGIFTITTSSRFLLVSSSDPSSELKEFAQFISQQFAGASLPSSATLPVVCGPENYAQSGDIVLKFDTSLAAEGYKIVVNSSNITISGADKRGLMYGAFMVIKQMRANGSATISGCTIQDTPDAAERTVMLDCGRKYFTPEWIKNYIREMAYMGYNTFEIHFAEDQGFRLNIWDGTAPFTSPNGNDFSWACGGMVGTWVPEAYQDYDDVGKYLTAKEMVEILEVAKQYQINVIPSFDTPMHCQYLRLAWSARVGGEYASELGGRITVDTSTSFVYNGKKYSSAGITDLSTGKTTAYDGSVNVWNNIMVKNDSGVRSGTKVIDVTNAVGRNLMLALIEDFAAFFKQYGSTEFNICADEVAFYELDYQKTYAQNVLGITNGTKYDTFTHYVNEATNMLQDKYGYKVRIFSDFVDRDGSGGSNYVQNLTFDKELEIVYWWLPEDNSSVRNVTHFVNNNYTVYNAVENYTYYVLALYNDKDDRGGVRSSWSHVTAQKNYENWNPTVFTHPTKGSTNVVDASKVSGGYFLIWCDYAAMNTESQIWNGIDSSGTYNVIERMWSNVTKMWNYDVNSTLSYTNFAALCKELGDFPGYTSCSAATTLPTAKEVINLWALDALLSESLNKNAYTSGSWANYQDIYAAAKTVATDSAATQATIDNAVSSLQAAIDSLVNITALTALLEENYSEDTYTEDSWANYTSACSTAEALISAGSATQAEVDAAVSNLQTAINGLKEKPFAVTIYHKTKIGGQEHRIATETLNVQQGVPFTHEIFGRTGYDLISVEGCDFTPLYSGADGGIISGTFTTAASITVWYENTPHTNQLEALLDSAITDSAVYSDESWADYNAALEAAQSYYDSVKDSPNTSTCQEDLQEYVDMILAARNDLAAKDVTQTKIISLKLATNNVARGKKAILIITTTTDVTEITVDGVELSECYGQPTVNVSGEAVKLWYVSFVVTESGTYTVHAGTATEDVEITCK